MPDQLDLGYAAKLAPAKAIEFFTAKGYAVSWNWWDTWESAHARAFTVAKAVQTDVLASIRDDLHRSLLDGRTRREFVRQLEPRLQALGWWGRKVIVDPDGNAELVRLGSPHRLRTIFDSNMRSTFGAARQQQQVENTGSRPFWMYDARNDGRVRPSHAAMDGQVFRNDDPIWKTHYPPNGWNCRCRVRALTDDQVKQRGLRVRDSGGALKTVEQKVGVDKRTGEVVTRPGTAYRFRGPGGQRRVMTPDAGWGSAPRGLAPAGSPPAPRAPRRRRPARTRRPKTLPSNADLRSSLAGLREKERGKWDELQEAIRRINAGGAGPAEYRERAKLIDRYTKARRAGVLAGRRMFQRSTPAEWRGGGEVGWATQKLQRKWSAEVVAWRKMINPKHVPSAPRATLLPSGGASAAYWMNRVNMSYSTPPGAMVHELTHLLEADRATLKKAAGFLTRRRKGKAAAVINSRGDIGWRDKFVDPAGNPQAYPGRRYVIPPSTYLSPGMHRVSVGEVPVYATEIFSQGVEWLWLDPVGFAATDPEYFDFIVDNLLR